MKDLGLRKANTADMPMIESCIEELSLDNEDLEAEQFIVAEKDGRIVGFRRMKPYEYCSELGCLAVQEDCRNRSIGSAVVKRLVQDFPGDDAWITTDIPEYFERFGFRATTDAPREIHEKIKRVCQSGRHANAIVMLLRRRGTPA